MTTQSKSPMSRRAQAITQAFYLLATAMADPGEYAKAMEYAEGVK